MIICAEMSCNHAQSYQRAERIVHEAHAAGADAVKLQYWMQDTMVANDGKMAPPPWSHMTLFRLYREAHTPLWWLAPLRGLIQRLGMKAVVTPFDLGALHALERIGGWDFYKIASPEAHDEKLVEAVGATGKMVVISGGSMSADSLLEVCRSAVAAGSAQAIPCWCVSKYPAHPRDACLPLAVQTIGKYSWGLSDHTRGIGVAVAAAVLGASYIEKHLILDDGMPTLDQSFSLVPKELAALVGAVRDARDAMEPGNERPIAGMVRKGGWRE